MAITASYDQVAESGLLETRVCGSHAMIHIFRWSSVLLFILIALLYFCGMADRKEERFLSIYDASISGEMLAIVGREVDEGSNLAAFNLSDPSSGIKIFTESVIDSPLVVDNTRVIFVSFSRDRSDDVRYRLIEVRLAGEMGCKILTKSRIGITEPFLMRGKFADRVFFLTGRDDSSTSIRITFRKIAYLEDNIVHTFHNAEIYPLATISQLDEARILGGAYAFRVDGGEAIQSPNSSPVFPVEIEITGDTVIPTVSKISKAELGDLSDFFHSSETGFTVVKSNIGLEQKLSLFDGRDHLLKTINLPGHMLFGSILGLEVESARKFSIKLLAVDEPDLSGEVNLVTVSEDGSMHKQALPTLGLKEFDLDACLRGSEF